MDKIPYGSDFLNAAPLLDNNVDVYLPKKAPAGSKTEQLSRIIEALDESKNQLLERFRASSKSAAEMTVGITVNDPTRPIPNDLILPPLLNSLLSLGLEKKQITLFIATGTHKDLKTEELKELLGENNLSDYRTHVHDCRNSENLSYLGLSQIGTPIYVNTQFFRCDLKIVTGHIEPHHFMGYSGGVKSAAIGLASVETIEQNHRLIKDPKAVMGLYEENPMRQDIEEIGEGIGIDFALNVVLNDEKQVINAFFGEPKNVMKNGIKVSREICNVNLRDKYDIVFASPGGYPKDINLYQSQKAITHACNFLKPGGVVVLCAECREGFGSEKFESFYAGKTSPAEIISQFESNTFEVGPHKAYQMALQQRNFKIMILSSLLADEAKKAFLEPVKSVIEALEMARKHVQGDPAIAFLPFATHIIAG